MRLVLVVFLLFLYNSSERLVHIASNESESFLVGVGLHQDGNLSKVLLITLMDRLSRCSQQEEGVRSQDLIFAFCRFCGSLGFLQLTLGWFAAECDVSGMTISMSNLSVWFSARRGWGAHSGSGMRGSPK